MDVSLRTEPGSVRLDDAARLGADAVILADLGLLAYAAKHHPGLRRHLSVQAAAAPWPGEEAH